MTKKTATGRKKSAAQVKKETLAALGVKAPGKRAIWAPVVDAELRWGEAELSARSWGHALREAKTVSNFAVKVADRSAVKRIFTTIEKTFEPRKVAVFTELLGASFNVRAAEHLDALMDALSHSRLQLLELRWLRAKQPIPAGIGKLTSLRELNVPGESVIDPYLAAYPPELWTLATLEILCFHAHGFEVLPEEITRLENLQILDLRGAPNLTTLSRALPKLAKLEYIDFGPCNRLPLAHAIPILAEVPNLRWLRLKNQLAPSTPPAALGRMRELQFLSIGAINDLPKEAGELESLRGFDGSWSALERLPPSFAELPNLKALQLEQTGKLDVAGALEIVLKSRSLRRVRWDVSAIDEPKARRLLDAGWRQIRYGSDDGWTKLE